MMDELDDHWITAQHVHPISKMGKKFVLSLRSCMDGHVP